MAKNFRELRAAMSPEAQERARLLSENLSATIPLAELRLARGLSQQNLADTLHISQAAVSKMERRTDMYISTLRSHIRAMGGDLQIVARFPDGAVDITHFADMQVEG